MTATTLANGPSLPPGRAMLRSLPWVAVLLAMATVAGLAIDSRPAGDAPKGIVARVNGTDITTDELRRVQADLLEMRRLRGQADDELPGAGEFEQRAIQTLIERRLLLQEAARRGLSVSDDDLDAAVGELRRRFADLDNFGAWMQERGLGDLSLFETVRGDLLVRRVTAALTEDIEITEVQVAGYYDTHKEDLRIGEEIRLGIIAVNSLEAGEAILRALREGVNFRRLAREVSVGQRSAEGGDTGWLDVAALPQPLREVAAELREGEASGRMVKKSETEFLVVALAGRRPVHAATLEEARPEIERRLVPVEKQRTVANWLRAQEAQAQVEVFVGRRPWWRSVQF